MFLSIDYTKHKNNELSTKLKTSKPQQSIEIGTNKVLVTCLVNQAQAQEETERLTIQENLQLE